MASNLPPKISCYEVDRIDLKTEKYQAKKEPQLIKNRFK